MKRNTLFNIFILSGLFTLQLKAQSVKDATVKDAFDPTVKITWLGLDFSGAKYAGDYEHLGTDLNLKSLMASLNDLMSIERGKFNIEEAFNKQEVDYKLEVTQKHNADLKTDGTYSNTPGMQLHLKQEDIDKIVAGYDFSGLNGIGLMFNVETINKLTQQATIFVTFINMNNKKVLFTERMSAEPQGFGIRNYWAGAVYAILKRIDSKELKKWRDRN